MELIRSGVATPCHPIKVFAASNVADAFKYFALGTRTGKVAVSFEVGENPIRLLPKRYETSFHADKTYIMVGCLGGIGRSISKWMFSLGARDFVFVGRSGTDKPVARDLVHGLEEAGAMVTVIRGDVNDYKTVERAVVASALPVGGVVQAAMALSEALWTAMSNESWRTTMLPKVRGTWNLHKALRNCDLDFFLMTSSISGTVGTATESNYCSANAFLDAFARHRRASGLPGIAVGLGMISEVGYLHEHPEIERLLLRKGIHSITEDELLQILDVALSQDNHPISQPSDPLSQAHLLTGIEFIGLEQQRARGFEGDNHVLADPRASTYAAAFSRTSASTLADTHAHAHSSKHHLPPEILTALQDDDPAALLEAVTQLVSRKIANLILLPVEKLRLEKPLGEFGIDSMLAAEFRTFVYQGLGVDVPFMTLLDGGTSLGGLVAVVVGGLRGLKRC